MVWNVLSERTWRIGQANIKVNINDHEWKFVAKNRVWWKEIDNPQFLTRFYTFRYSSSRDLFTICVELDVPFHGFASRMKLFVSKVNVMKLYDFLKSDYISSQD